MDALRIAVYILNMVPSKAVPKTPFELWKGWKPSLKYLQIWDEIRVNIPLLLTPNVGNSLVVEPLNNEDNPVNDQPLHDENIASNELVVQEEPALRRSTRERRSAISDDYMPYLIESGGGSIKDPIYYSQAMIDVSSDKWIDANNDEIDSMVNNEVWDIVPLPEGHKAVGCKWIFKTKLDCKGIVERYKARIVAKRFNQKKGIDYCETFSPVSRKDSLRIILALVAQYDLELHQMDMKTAFLNGDLEEEVYMCQPEGFIIEGIALLAMCISLTEVPSNGKARKSQLIYTSTIEAECAVCEERITQLGGSLGKLHGEVASIKAGCESMSSRLGVLEKQMTSIAETLSRIEAISFSDCGQDKGISLSSLSLPQVPSALPVTDGTTRWIGYRRIFGAIENQESMLKNVEMPVFDGRLPYGWISRVERFFQLGHYAEKEKLALVALHLEGSVLNWFYGEMEKAPISNWSQFRNIFLVRFAPVMSCSPPVVLMTKQLIPGISQEEESRTETKLMQRKELMDGLPSQFGYFLDYMHSNFVSDDLPQEVYMLPVKNELELALQSSCIPTKPCPYKSFENLLLMLLQRETQQGMQKKIPKTWKFKYKGRTRQRDKTATTQQVGYNLEREKKDSKIQSILGQWRTKGSHIPSFLQFIMMRSYCSIGGKDTKLLIIRLLQLSFLHQHGAVIVCMFPGLVDWVSLIQGEALT
ncbi:unnamed protein product [Microthlaspi erraticum]|uniref:Reverse transcriptase Ty1/copia-type domain-containing protein n=1 Tax=Microthlaspi erraticum TaxID=1685480 RepID=A0A6D2KBD3_9BRAS|nr:unnamed protein product [Microthlaspi erraticum]